MARNAGPVLTQWLTRLTFTYQASPNTSFSLGLRNVFGTAPIASSAPLPASRTTNLSAALHRVTRHGELYLVYGDANALNTIPRLLLKYVRYVGAQKGT